MKSVFLYLFLNMQSPCLEKKFLLTCYVSMNLKNVLHFATMIYIILLLGKEPKKLHLMSLLHSIKHMWDTIGEQLAVNYSDIKSTECSMAYDSTKKLSEVLQVWIDKKTCEVSWKTIITVIDDPPIENKRVGDEICEFLTRSDIQNEYLSTGKLEQHFVHIYIYLLITVGYSFPTFNAPPPITPRTRTNKGTLSFNFKLWHIIFLLLLIISFNSTNTC